MSKRTEPDPAHFTDPSSFSPHELKIVQKTHDVFSRSGAQQTSLRAVAREIGVSPSLLVYHFATHENLIVATMSWTFAERTPRSFADVGELEGLRDFAEKIVAVALPSKEGTRAYFMIYLDLVQFSVRGSRLSAPARVWRDNLLGFFEDAVAKAMTAGLLGEVDVPRLAMRIRVVIEGHTLRWVQDAGETTDEGYRALRNSCVDMLMAELATSV